MKRRRPVQQELPLRTWGGKRDRKPRSGRVSVPHRARPLHSQREPLHVTMRAASRLPSLRKQAVFLRIRRALAETARSWFRVVHFSVQQDHIHLIIEANDSVTRSRGMAGLSIRLARGINQVCGRRGRVWGDRYHARALSSPREVRNGLVYVLLNFRKHLLGAKGIDPMSSGFWFDGWKIPPLRNGPPDWGPNDHVPVQHPLTWLAATGWRKRGLIELSEHPKLAR